MKSNSKSNNDTTYSLLAYYDLFGAGYLVQQDEHAATAVSEGWVVLMSGRTCAEADYALNLYKTIGKPETAANELGLELVYDMTEPIETRAGQQVQELDLVRLPLDLDGNGKIWREHTITDYDNYVVELDGCIEISRKYAESCMELIAKVETNSFVIEYGEFLNQLEENYQNAYSIAVRAEQTGVAA